MIVNKSDWHYKLAYDNFFSRALQPLNLFFSPKPTTNLCQYVRQIFKTILNIVWIPAFFVYYILAWVGFIMLQQPIISVPDTHSIIKIFLVFFNILGVVGVIFTLVLIVVFIMIGIFYVIEYVAKHIIKRDESTITSKLDIIKARIKAFKDKTCPLITIN